jgi:glycogen synthase
MDEQEKFEGNREEIYSEVIRAGKRTYFFDVKETRSGEQYLTITESKRRFNNEQGKFFYEKHKIFLYKEDFEKFSTGLKQVIEFIETGNPPTKAVEPEDDITNPDMVTNVKFEDLGDPDEEKGMEI